MYLVHNMRPYMTYLPLDGLKAAGQASVPCGGKKTRGRERLGHYENIIRTKFRGSTFEANARQKDVMNTRQTLICMSLALQPFLLLQPPE